MRSLSTIFTAVALALALMTSLLIATVMVPGTVSAYATCEPIYIDGDAGFTEANGTSGGSGTASDPYIIEGWEISAATANGIQIQYTAAHFTIRDCYVHDGGASYDGILLLGCSNGTVTGNVCSGNLHGIWLDSSSNNALSGNNCSSNSHYGIYLYSSSNNTLIGNTCSNDDYGILLYTSGNNTLIGNTCSSNSNHGITLYSSSNNNTLIGNTCSNDSYGMFLGSSSNNNTLIGNTCSSNSNHGIFLYTSSNNNALSGNNASSNGAYGVCLMGSTETTVYHNIFFDNVVDHAYDDRGSENHWNASYPIAGNYWDTYTGVDEFSGPNQNEDGPDGIGDTPYEIDADSFDYYPLMEPEPPNTPPTASFTVSPSTGDVDTVFSVDASSSSDAEDDVSVLEVRWDFDGDGIWDTDWSTEKVAYHQYATPGVYTVRLEVRDTQGLTDVTELQIEVWEVIPEFPTAVAPILVLLFLVAVITRGRFIRRG